MNQQDDLMAVAKATKALSVAICDPGMMASDAPIEQVLGELSANGIIRYANSYIATREAALSARADMMKACILMSQEAEKVDAAVKAACHSINGSASKMAQSLQKTKDIMGPQVEERLRQMERLIAAIDRMKELEQDGSLQKYIAALTAKK